MTESPEHTLLSPLDSASLPSQLFMLWMLPIIQQVQLGQVTEASLTALPQSASVAEATSALRAAVQSKPVHFFKALLSVFGGRFLRWGSPQVVAMLGQMGIAVILSELISWLKSTEEADGYGYLLAVLMLLLSFMCAMPTTSW